MTTSGPDKSDSAVDRPFKAGAQGKAKTDFTKAASATVAQTPEVSESIKKHASALNYDMSGGGEVRAQYAAERVQAEKASSKFQGAAQRAAEKKLANSKNLSENFNEKSSHKGRE